MEQDMTTVMPQMDMSGAPQQKSGKGLKIATALMTVIAFCGVGFGVFGMIQSQKKDDKDTTTVTTTNTDIDDKKNPVISTTTPISYSMGFTSGVISSSEENTELSLGLIVKNGEVSECTISSVDYNDGPLTYRFLNNCDINGITGKIYKVVEIGKGHDALDHSIAFIMEDGSVEYLSLNDALTKSDFNIEGKLKLDKFVIDAINIAVSEDNVIGAGGSTIFVFSDGTYTEYDESMLK